jgi:hypothetical protein
MYAVEGKADVFGRGPTVFTLHLRHGYLCSNDYRDLIETLKAWGVLRGGISVR